MVVSSSCKYLQKYNIIKFKITKTVISFILVLPDIKNESLPWRNNQNKT